MIGAERIIGKRRFSPMKREYLGKLKDWRNSQMDVLRQTKPLTDEDQDKWFRRITDDKAQVIFAITEDDKFIGYCGITNIDKENGRGEISFLVDPDRATDLSVYRRDFLAALYALCGHAFDELGLHKLYTETYAFREEHMNILEEFGLRNEGSIRDHKFVKGRYWDSFVHSVLDNEWPEIKEKRKDAVEG